MKLQHSSSRAPWTVTAALAVALVLGALPAATQAAAAQDDAQLQKQLDDARARLDDAARDVAELSRKLYGDDAGSGPNAFPGPRPRGAMLGINIGGGTDREDGVEVMGVSPSGPAQSAGLQQGDVITAIDGKPLRRAGERSAGRQLVDHLRGVQPGQTVKIDYLRGGRKLSTTVTTVPAEPPMFRMLREHIPMLEGMALPFDFDERMLPGGRGFRALELVPLTPKLGSTSAPTRACSSSRRRPRQMADGWRRATSSSRSAAARRRTRGTRSGSSVHTSRRRRCASRCCGSASA